MSGRSFWRGEVIVLALWAAASVGIGLGLTAADARLDGSATCGVGG